MALDKRWKTAPTDPRLTTAATDARLKPFSPHARGAGPKATTPTAALDTRQPQSEPGHKSWDRQTEAVWRKPASPSGEGLGRQIQGAEWSAGLSRARPGALSDLRRAALTPSRFIRQQLPDAWPPPDVDPLRPFMDLPRHQSSLAESRWAPELPPLGHGTTLGKWEGSSGLSWPAPMGTRARRCRTIDGGAPEFAGDLQRAIYVLEAAGGGLLCLPPCVTITVPHPPLVIRRGGISIVGGGPSTRLTVPANARAGAIIELQSPADGKESPILLEGFRLSGQNRASCGLRLDAASQPVRVRDVDITDCSESGISAIGGRSLVLTNVAVYRCLIGIYLQSVSKVSLFQCTLQSNAGVGLGVEYSSGVSLADCRIAGAARAGVVLVGSSGVLMTGCHFWANSHTPLFEREAIQIYVGALLVPIWAPGVHPETLACSGISISRSYFDGAYPSSGLARLATTGVLIGRADGTSIIGDRFTNHQGPDVIVSDVASHTTAVANVTSRGDLGRDIEDRAGAGMSRIGTEP